MVAASVRSIPRRRLAWLLWFGVLFALAQAAASAHAISHIGQESGRAGDRGLVHAQCDLCLLGATIGGAAPVAGAPQPVRAALAHVLRAVEFGSAPTIAPAQPYQSRAPPAASR